MFKLFASAITLSLFTLLSACGGGSDTTAGNGVAAYAGHYVGTVTGVTSAADSGTFEVTVDIAGPQVPFNHS